LAADMLENQSRALKTRMTA